MSESPLYPSPSSSIADTVLPTPDQPYSSYQSSLASPSFSDMSPSTFGESEGTPKRRESDTVPEQEHDLTPGLLGASTTSKPNFSSMSSNRSQRRSVTNPNPARVPPPPILLRRPTDMHTGKNEDVPLSAGSSGSPNKKSAGTGGLNISGLPGMPGADMDEAGDFLPDLMKSPTRNFFAAATPSGAPASPAWPSFERQSPRVDGSPLSRHKGRPSLDVPFSPLGQQKGTQRFDPTPQHGIHARNLSLYFPQPGAPAQDGVGSGELVNSPEPVQDVMISGGKGRKVFGGAGDWSFGSSNPAALEPSAAEGGKRGKRRGHHHKHSLSHNFFSFLDPTQTNPALASPDGQPASPRPRRSDTPHKVPMLLAAPTITPSSPTLSPLPPSRNSSHSQMLLSFGILQFLIGAGLWIEGQMSGWRCLAGLGYLVVFDAMGVGVSLLSRGEAWSNVRRPYGTARFLSLMYFAQSLFLVFSAVYIAKESLEQVVLGAGAHDHGGGGSHSHGEAVTPGDERPFPIVLLISATLASIFSGGALGNHGKLIEAVGPLFLPQRFTSLRIAQRYASLLGNPFSVTIAGTTLAVLVGSLVSPLTSLHSLDSALSLLLAILTSALAYPPTLAFGHVLLQTAPPATSSQMKLLRRATKDITGDSRVLGVGTLRCWSIGATSPPVEITPPSNPPSAPGTAPSSPHASSFSFSPLASPSRLDFGSMRSSAYGSESKHGEDTPLVVSLIVHVHPEASDRDILDVTRQVWSRVSAAVGQRGGRQKDGGEVTVSIKRGWDGAIE